MKFKFTITYPTNDDLSPSQAIINKINVIRDVNKSIALNLINRISPYEIKINDKFTLIVDFNRATNRDIKYYQHNTSDYDWAIDEIVEYGKPKDYTERMFRARFEHEFQKFMGEFIKNNDLPHQIDINYQFMNLKNIALNEIFQIKK